MLKTDHQNRERLPAAVYDLAIRLGVKPVGVDTGVRLTQTGQMLRSLGSASWMKFSAVQTISVQDCAFDWQARFGPFGVIAVRDALENGQVKAGADSPQLYVDHDSGTVVTYALAIELVSFFRPERACEVARA
jgi:hypothetical protein